jgi:phosphoserine phosphatase
MSSNSFESLIIPEGLTYADDRSLEERITTFAGAGAIGLHVVLDFDRTLNTRNSHTGRDMNSWSILREYLDSDEAAQYDERSSLYMAKEDDGTLTPDDAVAWWSKDLDMFVEQQIDMGAVESEFLQRSNIRPGTTELFDYLNKQGIPSVILSAGISNVIELWSKQYSVQPSLILATLLEVDPKNGQITGWNRDTLIHVLNKREVDHPQLNDIRAARPNIIIAGDSLDDADMAIGDTNVIRVRIHEPRNGKSYDIADVRRRTFERFDAFIEGGNLLPLRDLIQVCSGDTSQAP